jgi:hypothetical protein
MFENAKVGTSDDGHSKIVICPSNFSLTFEILV